VVEVYANGDIHVSYVDLDQWFPFKMPSLASTGWLLNDADAQVAPPSGGNQQLPPLQGQYDIDNIIQQKEREADLEKNPTAIKIRRDFVIADIFGKHALEPSNRDGVQTFYSEPGYRIVSADLVLSSASNYQLLSVQTSQDGGQVTVRYRLRSGPIYDQWRGWIKATLQTTQLRIQ
jgi:hypothetical protein